MDTEGLSQSSLLLMGRRPEMCMVLGQQQGRDGRYEMVEVSVNKSPDRWRDGKERGRKMVGMHSQS